ncbi:MAG: WHG domain-containing protein, partial [Alphaproteobacteria bacterium]|nr:WHG domain-containing protein [Alphaproteobacteria bacterium]
RALGIRPPSVYHHFAGNDALRHAVAVEGWKALVASLPAPGDDPADALRGFARAYRAFALANPALYRLMTRVPFDPTDPALLEVTARGFAALQRLGIPPDQALHAIRALRAAVHGFVDLELSGQVRLGVPADDSFEWLVELGARGLAGGSDGR